MSGWLAPLDHARVRGQPAPARHRPHRPLPDAPARSERRHRRDARRADATSCTRARSATSAARRCRRRRSSRRSGSPSAVSRERFVCEQPPYSILVRGIEADVLPTCQRYGMAVIPWSPLAGGWLSGKWRIGGDDRSPATAPTASRRATTSTSPGTSRSSRRPTRSASSPTTPGIPLVHLAVAWVLQQPGGHVGDHRAPHDGAARRPSSARPTSTLDDDVLDRIDEIVPPGTNFTWADAGYSPPMIADPPRTAAPCK